MVDLAGFPKDRYHLYQSVWTKKPMVHLLPHWNWQEGQTIPVMAYSNGDEIELFLNGKSLGRKKRFSQSIELPVGEKISPDRKYVTKYRLDWQVPFEPGTLRAVAYQNGKQVASDEMPAAGTLAVCRAAECEPSEMRHMALERRLEKFIGWCSRIRKNVSHPVQ